MPRRDPNATLARMASTVLLGFGTRPKHDVLFVELARATTPEALEPILDWATRRIARMAEAARRRHGGALTRVPPVADALAPLGLAADGQLVCADPNTFERSPLAAAVDVEHPVWNDLPDGSPVAAGRRWLERVEAGTDGAAHRGAAVLRTAIEAREAQWRWLALTASARAQARIHLWRPWRAFEVAQRGLVDLFDGGELSIDALGLGAAVTRTLVAGIESCGVAPEVGRMPSVWTLSELRGIGEGTLGKLADAMFAAAAARYDAGGAPQRSVAGESGSLDAGLADLAALFDGAPSAD